MNDFYLLTLSYLGISKLLTFYYTLGINEDKEDYFPLTIDRKLSNKIIWYFSQLTYTSNTILFFYYFMRYLTGNNYDTYFKIISPISLAVNTNYFLILYPEKNIKLFELPYHSLVSHFMTTFSILIENKYINWGNYIETFNYNYLILLFTLITGLNYKYRRIWTYNKLNLFTLKSYKLLFQFMLCSQLYSSVLWLISL